MRVKETAPMVVAVTPGSIAERVGLRAADEIVSVNGVVPRDVIEWRMLTDDANVDLEIRRGGICMSISIEKADGEAVGLEISSAVFDRVRTCDNHCPFCFIYQLPPGMRRSLYLKDDDYRLSFLYGNFTTLTRFTEADLERIVLDGLSPLNVSIHSTNPEVRAGLLRNVRGSISLRWLKALLKAGITVNGQIVVCPGINDGDRLVETLLGILDEFPDLRSVAVVPLGVSRYNAEVTMREHTLDEANRILDIVEEWQQTYLRILGRRLVHAADEYYLMTGRPFPQEDCYEGFQLHEDGIGMARTFALEFDGHKSSPTGTESGFFAWVDGARPDGYRAVRNPACDTSLRHGSADGGSSVVTAVALQPRRIDGSIVEGNMRSQDSADPRVESPDRRPIGILTGTYGAKVLEPLIESLGRTDIRVLPVDNDFFGGNIGVTGLLVGSDVARVLADQPSDHRYLLPDVCLSEGRFLDGSHVTDLPVTVEVVATDGISLRRILQDAR